MRNAKAIGIILLFGAVICITWLVLSQEADGASVYKDARTTSQTHTQVTRITRELSEARHVERATREYTTRYGANVGRWVWLARDVGWAWKDMPMLMYVINRESGGHPTAKNPISTASGLLQFLAFHWDGSGGYGWQFNPFSARQNLLYGHKLYHKSGWSPWAL